MGDSEIPRKHFSDVFGTTVRHRFVFGCHLLLDYVLTVTFEWMSRANPCSAKFVVTTSPKLISPYTTVLESVPALTVNYRVGQRH